MLRHIFTNKPQRNRQVPSVSGRKELIMKEILSFMILAMIFLSGCGSNANASSGDLPPMSNITDVRGELFYGEVELPNDLFSINALYNNSLVYLTNNDAGIGVSIFDVNTGNAVEVCKLEDYLMSPANCAILGETLYFNYMANDGLRKMIAIDIQCATAETVITEEGINGLVYSVASCGNIFSLKHNSEGLSIVECYAVQEKTSNVYLNTNETMHAISSFDGQLYLIMSDKDGKFFVRQYDEKGDVVETIDISYADSILHDSQVGRFQMMDDSLYLMNFSSQSELFNADGISLEAVEDWCIATDSSSESPQYVFFSRGSDKELIIYESGMDEFRGYELDIPEDYVIRYVYSDMNNPQRVLVSLRNTEKGDEFVSIVDTDS